MAVSKKIANVFLACVLLMATVGITLNRHYCMGRLKSVAVYEHAAGCKGAGTTDPMPCCKDVSEVLQVDDMSKVAFEFQFATTVAVIASPLYDLSPVPTDVQSRIPLNNHTPPPEGADFLILHQVFRI